MLEIIQREVRASSLCGSFQEIETGSVEQLRRVIGELLRQETFFLEVGAALLSQLESSADRSGAEPIIVEESTGVTVQVFSWKPGQRVLAHCHSGWTVTGMVSGTMEFQTYDFQKAQVGSLEVTHRFLGRTGGVGRILTPTIHSGTAAGNACSLTLHVFTNYMDRSLEESVACVTSDFHGLFHGGLDPGRLQQLIEDRIVVSHEEQREITILALIGMLDKLPDSVTRERLIERCHSLMSEGRIRERQIEYEREDPSLGTDHDPQSLY